jgi:predicted kinase
VSRDLAALLARARAAPVRAGGTRVIGIDGRSGAGKSTLALLLAPELDAAVVHLDRLYDGWDGLERGVAALEREVLTPLAAGEPVLVPHYDWLAGDWDVPWPLGRPQTLIVEGVGAGARPGARHLGLLVWLEAPVEIRRERALARDGEVYAPHWDRWAAQEDALLAREHTPERADVVVDTTVSDLAGLLSVPPPASATPSR